MEPACSGCVVLMKEIRRIKRRIRLALKAQKEMKSCGFCEVGKEDHWPGCLWGEERNPSFI
jgi:hypothetical protein